MPQLRLSLEQSKCIQLLRKTIFVHCYVLFIIFPVLQKVQTIQFSFKMAKKEKVSKQSLSVEDTKYLKENTSYSEEDIKSWFK